MINDNDDEDFDEEGDYFLTCDVCGAEEQEDKADEAGWISMAKMDTLEVVVCTECSTSEEKLREGFEVFVKELAAIRRVRRQAMS